MTSQIALGPKFRESGRVFLETGDWGSRRHHLSPKASGIKRPIEPSPEQADSKVAKAAPASQNQKRKGDASVGGGPGASTEAKAKSVASAPLKKGKP